MVQATWNTTPHQVPERRQLWHDPLTNEQYFGIVATDPGKIPDAAVESSPTAGPLRYLYAWADHSYVHLEVTARDATPESLRIDADVVPGPEGADYRISVDRDSVPPVPRCAGISTRSVSTSRSPTTGPTWPSPGTSTTC